MKKLYMRMMFYVVIFLACIILIISFFMDVIALTLLLFILLIISLRFDYRKGDAYYVIIAAILGPVGEIICIYFGVWRYANPTLLGIPLWLPVLWGATPLAIIKISRIIKELRK